MPAASWLPRPPLGRAAGRSPLPATPDPSSPGCWGLVESRGALVQSRIERTLRDAGPADVTSCNVDDVLIAGGTGDERTADASRC